MKIIRNDRGLDFKRIEKLIANFHDKTNKIIRGFKNGREQAIKDREKGSYEHFGLSESLERIKEIDDQIKNLKQSKEIHENKIRDFTQGSENRYGSYDNIREGSPIHKYINDVDVDFKEKETELKKLNDSIFEQLWKAKDIEAAVEIIDLHDRLREEITLK